MRQLAMIVALVALGACHNGPSSNHDTTGMTNSGGSGAIQTPTPVVGPSGAAAAPTTPAGTAVADTAKKATKKGH